MSSPAARSPALGPRLLDGTPLRVAFLGACAWLEGATPPTSAHGLIPARFEIGPGADVQRTLVDLQAYRPHVSVVFDPPALGAQAASNLPGVTLGVLVTGPDWDEGLGPKGPDREELLCALGALDRLVSFAPALTGRRVGDATVWRAIPAPVSDALFAAVAPKHHAPRAMSIGRSTAHREAMLEPAKHRCDLLHVVHGLSGAELVELLGEYDVGVYAAAEQEGGFDWQVGAHLAVGHLLIADRLVPAHGLEPNIDYLCVDSPDGLASALERLARFPEMHDGIRVRGRLKAEGYRASRLFARVVHDLLADVSAFGADAA
jgi:hypothetical protein